MMNDFTVSKMRKVEGEKSFQFVLAVKISANRTYLMLHVKTFFQCFFYLLSKLQWNLDSNALLHLTFSTQPPSCSILHLYITSGPDWRFHVQSVTNSCCQGKIFPFLSLYYDEHEKEETWETIALEVKKCDCYKKTERERKYIFLL